MQKTNLNQDWLFTDGQTLETKIVCLPHDATIGTDRDPSMEVGFLSAGFSGGKYQYSKKIVLPEADREKAVYLEFEGIYRDSTLLVNGIEVGKKLYGYTPFGVRLDPYLRFGETNDLTVLIDTPVLGHNRWYSGSGIYQDVNLYVGEKTHVAPFGVQISTLSHQPALIRVQTTVEQEALLVPRVSIEILDGDRVVAQGEGTSVDLEVGDAQLWCAETPHLYTARIRLWAESRLLDETTVSFGIRTLRWSAEEGFLLNGVRTLLRGGCIHNDNGVIGMIANRSTEARRVKNIKAAGFNAVRSAHHPMSRALLEACDQFGLYVMDEAWDTWYRMKQRNGVSRDFAAIYLDETELMVRNDYNHPSVLLYSIGNEICEIGSLKGVRIGKSLIDRIKSIDQTRPVLTCPSMRMARDFVDGTPYMDIDEDEFLAKSPENVKFDWDHYISLYMKAMANVPSSSADPYPKAIRELDEKVTLPLYSVLDMAGYNYYTDKFETLHEMHPDRVIIGTETRGHLIVPNWKLTKKHPYLVGDFIWTLQDHIGETNVCGIEYANEPLEKGRFPGRSYPWLLNYGGVLDLIGRALPAIHRFQFVWGGHSGLHLASQPPTHDGCEPKFTSYKWTDTISSWTYEGYEGKPTFIDVYADAAEAEVRVNGRSLGRKKLVDYFAKFSAVYEPGEVVGIAFDAFGNEVCRSTMRTAAQTTKIRAIGEPLELLAGGNDFCFINVDITDEYGVVKSLPEREIHVQIEGAGILQGLGSADPKNIEKYTQTHHRTHFGSLLAVIRSGKDRGSARVKISSEGLDDVFLTIPVR